MRKTVLTFGLISGIVSAALMLAMVPFIYRIGFDKGTIVGYTSIVISLLLVPFAIWTYREDDGEGSITFAKAFGIGILITVISSLCYVIAWAIVYYNFLPDFADRYAAYMVEKAKASGATQQVIDATLQEMKSMKTLLDNPLIFAAIGFAEPFPVGLIITTISAAILRKKRGANNQKENMGAPAVS